MKTVSDHGKDLFSRLLRWCLVALAAVSFALLGYMIVDLSIQGFAGLSPSLFAWSYDSDNVSLTPALINTILMVALTLLLSVPLSVGAAVFLVEYARPKSRLAALVLMAMQTLSGVPSIVFGLFGSIFFVRFCHLGLSLASGALTMALMVLPLGMKTAQEALLEVPMSMREASYGLGAGKARTIFHIVLPVAAPGIFNGIVLSIGRVVGESAALIFTAGTLAKVSGSLLSSARTLAVHMYALSSEGLHMEQCYATALILLLLTIAINALSTWISRRIERKKSHG